MSPGLRGLTLTHYLDEETRTGIRHEYYRGEIFAMVGGTPRHALIATNFTGEARLRLGNSKCVPYNGDLRIKIDDSGLYTYPDASIICGPLQLDDLVPNTVVNPTVIVEVLSDSTEKYDRSTKSEHYRRIPSLQDLVLISQDRPLVECYSRHPSGGWLLRDARHLSELLVLESVGIEIPLFEIYRNVEFDPPEPLPPPLTEVVR
jgi:Uma2 family endonuclease